MLYIEIIKVRDLDVLPNARYTQSHGKWAEKDRNFAVTLTIEPVFMRVTREGVKIMVVFIGLCVVLLHISALILGLAGTVVALLGLAVLITYSVKNGIILLVIAFLLSPFGLPMLAVRVLGVVQDVNYALRDFIRCR